MTPMTHRAKDLKETDLQILPWPHSSPFTPLPTPMLLGNTMSLDIFPHPLCSLMYPVLAHKKELNGKCVGWMTYDNGDMQIAMGTPIYGKTLAQTRGFIEEWRLNCAKVKIWVGVANQTKMGKEPDIVAFACNPPYSRIWRRKTPKFKTSLDKLARFCLQLKKLKKVWASS